MHIGGILRRNPETRHIRTMHIAEVLVAGWEEDWQNDKCRKFAWELANVAMLCNSSI